jgi:outer membrane receptor protein involved in Fe transport
MNAKQKYLWICLSLFLISINFVYSQGDEAEDPPVELEEITVISHVEKDTFNTPNAVAVVDREQIERINAPTTPRILRETVGVWAQQTTAGQGSPMLRGLTGYQAFLSIDGVRLNNSTFRSGPNQYLATVSPDSLDRVEVLRGAGSMLYGSGAMGGVISMFTKDLILDDATKEWKIESRAFGRYASGTAERLGRVELVGTQERIGFSLGASARQLGDINPGSGYDLHYANRKFEIVSDKPSGVPVLSRATTEVPDRWLVENEAPLSWAANDADAKLAYKLTDTSTVNLAYQLWRQPQTPRYDKIAPRDYDEFFFQPQDRDLLYATYLSKPEATAIDKLQFTTSFHRQKEGRNELLRDATERRERTDTVSTVGFSAQAVSSVLPMQRVVAGGEFYFDSIASQTVRTDITTGAENVDDKKGRFIDGSQFWDANFYLQDEIRLHKLLELTLGGRFTLYNTNADLSVRSDQFSDFNESGSALTYSAGLVASVTDGLNIVANYSTAFRAPSLNDTTAVEVTNEGIDSPSPDLESETAWTAEGGFKARYPQFSGSLTVFHGIVKDLVTRVPVEEAYAGQSLPSLIREIQQNNPGIDVYVFDNVDEVQIQGVEFAGMIPIPVQPGLSVYGNAMFTRGEVLTINGGDPNPDNPWEERMRREPPLNGIFGIRWEPPAQRFWSEFFVRASTAQNRLNRSDIRDPRIPGTTRDTGEVKFDSNGEAVGEGSPAWVTLNLRGGFQVTQYNRLTLALENLLDKRYREHGSGINGPGFNLIVSLDNRF